MRRSVLLVFVALVLVTGAVWLVWLPATEAPGVVDVSGRVEGDQAAVGAKIGSSTAGA